MRENLNGILSLYWFCFDFNQRKRSRLQHLKMKIALKQHRTFYFTLDQILKRKNIRFPMNDQGGMRDDYARKVLKHA